MNKSLPRQILIIFLGILVLLAGYRQFRFNKAGDVQAAGDLEITYLGLPLGDPIFYLEDTKPGDHVCREIDVANNGEAARFIAVKGVKTGGVGSDPLLESILEIVIDEDGSIIYGDGSPSGVKTVEDFFTDSLSEDGVLLSVVNPENSSTYNFCVSFPVSASNDFQEKSVIFDLIFGYIIGENIVINEVYYQVDESQGW